MLEVLAQVLGKLVGAVVDASAKWVIDRSKARRGVARLLDLHEALLTVETESIVLVESLRKYASESVKLKISLRDRLEPLARAVRELEAKLVGLAPIVSVTDVGIVADLFYTVDEKRRLLRSVLPALVPTVALDEGGKLTRTIVYVRAAKIASEEGFSSLPRLDGTDESTYKEALAIARARLHLNDGMIDAGDSNALLAAIYEMNARVADISETRKRLAAFIAAHFTLKEILA